MVSVINEGLYEFAASMLGLCTAQLQVMKQYFIRLFSICAGVCVCENSSIARMMLMCQIISSTVALIGSCIAYSL